MLNIWKGDTNIQHSTKEPTQDAKQNIGCGSNPSFGLFQSIETFVLLPCFVVILLSYFWRSKVIIQNPNVEDLLRCYEKWEVWNCASTILCASCLPLGVLRGNQKLLENNESETHKFNNRGRPEQRFNEMKNDCRSLPEERPNWTR